MWDTYEGTPCVVHLFSIGYDRGDQDQFLARLRAAGIHTVVDVRRYPDANDHPEPFRATNLRPLLEEAGLVYHLGGRHLGEVVPPGHDPHRPVLLDDSSATELGVRQDREGLPFATGIRLLTRLASLHPTAILARDPTSLGGPGLLIADHLTRVGHHVSHITASGETVPHRLCDVRLSDTVH